MVKETNETQHQEDKDTTKKTNLSDNESNFAKLLKRYVAYMEYLANSKTLNTKDFINNDTNKEAQKTYLSNGGLVTMENEVLATRIDFPTCKDLKDKKTKNYFPRSGEGHNGGKIQKVLSRVDEFELGQGESSFVAKIYMSARADNGYDKNSGNFLHWENSFFNIYPVWEEQNDTKNKKIKALTIAISSDDEGAKNSFTPSGNISVGDKKDKNGFVLQVKQGEEQAPRDCKYEISGNDIAEQDKLFSNETIIEMFDVFSQGYIQLRSYYKSRLLDHTTALLENNYNLILTGAPGTGKTFMAKNIAAKLIFPKGTLDFANFENWEPGQKYKFNKQCKFVQFHPSYDYTDFVEGLRSYDNNGQIGFHRQDGIFKSFCKEALKACKEKKEKASKYVFIIDEINRGELNKILGELFFSIDPGYRGEKGKTNTQYQNLVEDNDEFKNGFYIPENVYIIGTMNDIDRSVDAMDFAIRRRFAWKEVLAEETVMMLDTLPSKKYDIIDHMNRLNEKILNVFGSSSYQIGPSYFLKIEKYLDNGNVTKNTYQKLWDYHLFGVLQEYVRGRNDANDILTQLKNAYDDRDNSIKEEESEE